MSTRTSAPDPAGSRCERRWRSIGSAIRPPSSRPRTDRCSIMPRRPGWTWSGCATWGAGAASTPGRTSRRCVSSARTCARATSIVVHTHAGRAGALGRVAARRVGVRAIVHTLHGFPFNEFQSPVTRGVLRAIERRLGRITDYFLTDGTFVASEAVRLKIAPPDRIRALISPIDCVLPVSETARRHARRPARNPGGARRSSERRPVSTSRSRPWTWSTAIAALRRPDVYMVWLGDGELRGKTERLIARRGLCDRFLLLGDRSDVPQLLPAFDVFAISSLWEGLPCSVVEAMTCGIPVVATAVNSVPEVVIPGRTGLLARPGDPASLSRALAYMLDHPAEAARMARGCSPPDRRAVSARRPRRGARWRSTRPPSISPLTLTLGGASADARACSTPPASAWRSSAPSPGWPS